MGPSPSRLCVPTSITSTPPSPSCRRSRASSPPSGPACSSCHATAPLAPCTQDDIDHQSHRLIDAVTAWGDVEAIAARVTEFLQAGADHVAINVIGDAEATPPAAEWRRLAQALTATTS
jgi:hypothetical protein